MIDPPEQLDQQDLPEGMVIRILRPQALRGRGSGGDQDGTLRPRRGGQGTAHRGLHRRRVRRLGCRRHAHDLASELDDQREGIPAPVPPPWAVRLLPGRSGGHRGDPPGGNRPPFAVRRPPRDHGSVRGLLTGGKAGCKEDVCTTTPEKITVERSVRRCPSRWPSDTSGTTPRGSSPVTRWCRSCRRAFPLGGGDDGHSVVPLCGVFRFAVWERDGRHLYLAAAHEDRELPYLLVMGTV